ncbi:MAG: hypothetical protein H0U66_06650 [Gemmatimonadaceae bacterium]|nr:hypothetical protein [Gemmatimonadaceae bacterium]
MNADLLAANIEANVPLVYVRYSRHWYTRAGGKWVRISGDAWVKTLLLAMAVEPGRSDLERAELRSYALANGVSARLRRLVAYDMAPHDAGFAR